MAHFIERLLTLVQDPATHGAILDKGMLTGIAAEITKPTAVPRHRQCALEALRQLSTHASCFDKARAIPGLLDAIHTIAKSDDAALSFIAEAIERNFAGTSASSSAMTDAAADAKENPAGAAAAAAAAAAKKRTPRAITIDMTGLLGDKALNDAYTHALLLVVGVTSVTMDPKNNRVLVYTHADEEIRPNLTRAIENVRDIHREALGLPTPASTAAGAATATGGAGGPSTRAALAPMDQATYLDDEEDDFFGEGAIAERYQHESVEERIARKKREKAAADAEAAEPRARKRDVLFSMAKAATSWFGW